MNLTETQLIAFLSVTLLLTIMPGVDTFLVIRNVLRGGRGDGIYTGLGVCSGLFVHAALSALGISVILVHSAFLFSVIKWLGGLYLLWLGLVSLVGAWHNQVSVNVIGEKPLNTRERFFQSYREGLLSNVLNPKPALFYLAFFPQFLSSSDQVLFKSLLLCGIQFIIGVAWLSSLSLALSAFSRFFHRPAFGRFLRGTTGCILIGLGIKLATTQE